MSKKTIALIIVLLIVAGGLFALAFMPQKKGTPTIAPPLTAPAPTPVAQTTLLLTPNPLVIASQSASLNVSIDTGTNNATAVQIELSYNPEQVTAIDITPGTFFDNAITLLKNIDQKNGKLSFALATAPTAKAIKGTGTVATISFTTAIASGGKTDITFSPKSLVTAEKILTSVLKSATGSTIFYVQQQGSGQAPIGPAKPGTQSGQTNPPTQ